MEEKGKRAQPTRSSQALWTDIAEGISDLDLQSMAPDGWTPNAKQVSYARAYVSAPPLATIGEIAAQAGVNRVTVSHWRHGAHFRLWVASVLSAAAGAATDHVWRACHEKALKGDAGCIRMWVRRFDPVYATRIADSEGKRPDAAAIPEGTAEGAQDALNGP